jgi:tryptophanyl-tRNA synthetase
MPTTAQVTGAIDKMKESDISSGIELSQSGQKVAQRVDSVLDSAKNFLTEKNEGDCVQRLIHHSKLASKNLDGKFIILIYTSHI